ncbi:MAG: hypothetical protein H6741_08660 [Alphaproteobacteria bacterium]|nr:hypothetical protein [Alphaproteobacteria bacterium]
MTRWIGAAALLASLSWAPAALAGQVEDDVGAALNAIKDGDFEGARALLDKAEGHAAQSTSVVTSSSLASIHFYRGVLEYYDGDRDKKTLDHWRLALLADQNYAFDKSLVADQEPQDLFEALRMEIRARPHSEAGVAEGSDVRVFVDGRLLKEYDMVVSGRHLVQVLCADQRLVSSWHEFGDAPDYYAACGEQAVVTEVTDEPTEPVETKEPREKRELDLNVPKIAAWGGGGLFLVGGAVMNFAMVNPAWADIEAARAAPSSIGRDEANDLTRQFNVYRFTTLGLLTLGAAGVTTGFLIDDSGLVITPGGVGWSGSF